MKALFWTMATVAFMLFLPVMLWISMSSAYFLRIHDMTYDAASDTITLKRTVLSQGDLLARWHVAVQVPGGEECSDSGQDIYEPRYVDGSEKTTATFPSGELSECLRHPDAQIVASWQVLWMNFIPLKPTYFFKPPRS